MELDGRKTLVREEDHRGQSALITLVYSDLVFAASLSPLSMSMVSGDIPSCLFFQAILPRETAKLTHQVEVSGGGSVPYMWLV